MIELTIQLPNDLVARLKPVQKQLPEIIELGLRQLSRGQVGLHNEIAEFLASSPSPQAIVDFRPSPEAQARVAELLDKNQRGALTSDEVTEMDQYENLDYIMTLIKVQARRRLGR